MWVTNAEIIKHFLKGLMQIEKKFNEKEMSVDLIISLSLTDSRYRLAR